MSGRARPTGDFLEPDLSIPRIRKQWGAIALRLPARRVPVRRLALLVLPFAAAACFVWAWSRDLSPIRAPQASRSDDEVVVTEDQPLELALGDGSTVTLARSSRLHLKVARKSEVRLALAQGGAEFEVAHVAGRIFVVEAGRSEVFVVGTHFRVAVGAGSAGGVEVKVDRGRVRVRRDGEVHEISAGEWWSSDPAEAAPPPGQPTVPAQAPREAGHAGGGRIGLPPPSSGRAPEPEGPAQLFSAANRARLAGRLADAAALFDSVRRRFPGDRVAGLSAFELGRLRLDALHDAAGAAEAFRDALRLAPTAAFREDVEARLVEALERQGSLPECEQARGAYLTHHPRGARSLEVSRRCTPR